MSGRGKVGLRRKQCSGGPGLGPKGEGRGEECMGIDLNVTARVRKREGQKTNWLHFSRNSIEERRIIVRTTIVAFPTVPLLQQAGILYRRPLQMTHKDCLSHLGKRGAHARIHTHSDWASAGHTHTTADFHHPGRGRNTDSYPKQSKKAAASKTG